MSDAYGLGVILVTGSGVEARPGEHWVPLEFGGFEASRAILAASRVKASPMLRIYIPAGNPLRGDSESISWGL
jgi:hypothetical protein